MENLKNLKMETKKDFQNLMLKLLNPLKPYYSTEKAQLDLGVTMAHYDINATYMEAFSRPLWALVPFFAGGGRDTDFAKIYAKGLSAGTNPESNEYWGECGDFDQRFVEMAAISYGMLFAPKLVWDPLSEKEKDNLCRYLYKINEHPLPVCNWILFAVLVNIALKKRNRPYDAGMLTRYLDGLETFYLGDGWYQDGDSGQKDYYISFAIHFYTLIYAMVMNEEDPKRASLYKERAGMFAKQFIYWFDEDGDAIPFGRSLTYRFSQVSFFSVCLAAGVTPFPIPVMKGLIVRHLKSWLAKPIFDKNGILTIGYGYPNLIMAERYNAPGSPYWSMKVFAFLMLPDDHPFWTAEAAPYPVLASDCPMPFADMYVKHYGSHTTAFAPGVYSPYGHGQIVAKYGKFAYDSKFSISIAKSSYELCENAPDNMLAFVINGYVYVRRICEESKILENGVYSKWSPYPGITVETTLLPDEKGHTRIHKITSSLSCKAYDYGFSINRGDHVDVGCVFSADENWADAHNNCSGCHVSAVDCDGHGEFLYADPNQNLLYPKTVIPGICYDIHAGLQTLTTRVDAYYKKEN